MPKNAIIFCEVTCSDCGAVEYTNYRNAKSISLLKERIREWRYCGEKGNLCPNCYSKLAKGGKAYE